MNNLKTRSIIKIHSRVFIICTILIFFLGCKDIEEPDLFFSFFLNSGTGKIGIVSSDLGGAGHFSTMTPDGVPSLSFINIHSDAVVRYSHKRVYIINRLGKDNIQVLNPDLFYLPELEFSTEPGSNPHDFIRVNDDLAFVSRYNQTSILVVNPLTGLTSGTIDIGAYADADGIPEMSGMHLEGDRLFVSLQKLDRNHATLILPPTANSSILEIDTKNLNITNEYILPNTNPFGILKKIILFGQSHLIITNPGGIGVNHALDGGVAAFNLETNSFRPGLLYDENIAGGDILSVEIKNDSIAYALVMFANSSMALQTFDPSTGANTGTLENYPSTGGFVSEILLGQNGFLYVASATTSASGITIYDTNSANQVLTPFPIEVGLRPTSLVEIP